MKTAAKILSLLLLSCVAACGGGASFDDDDDVSVRTTSLPASGSLDPVASVSWFVYFAEEALAGPAGTDLNGDGDTSDQVAVAVRIGSRSEEELTGVAARGAALVGKHVWLVVDEADDGRDWNMSGMADDTVIVYWEEGTGTLTYVDTLEDGDSLVIRSGKRIYYASADPLGAGDVTNLRLLTRSEPTVPRVIESEEGAGPVRARFIGEDDKLLVLVQDEVDAGRDLNDDGDATDGFVIGLLKGTDGNSRLRNIGLAVFDENVPWNEYRDGNDKWFFGVLVNEAAQGANLNDQSLFDFPLLPDTCAVDDTDMDDDVLFFVRFPRFENDNGLGNTGLAGVDRVVVVKDYVATLSPETDAGDCDLNDDGDTADLIVRWARTRSTDGIADVEPPRTSRLMVPVSTVVPGGAFGLSPLNRRLVALVDEAADDRDFDGRPGDSVLVAWIEPKEARDSRDTKKSNWDFKHDSSDRKHGTGIYASDGASEPYASATWMNCEVREGRLTIGFDESVPGANPLVGSINNNVRCRREEKDADIIDSLPVWLDFEGRTLDFDGVGFAMVANNPGVIVSKSHAYFRVSEMADNRDYNGDNDLDDVLLMRNPTVECRPQVIDVVGSLQGPAIFAEKYDPKGAAFFSTGVDFDGDGNPTELVVRHFKY